MTFIEKIEASITSLTGLPFCYGSRADVNYMMDNAQLPSAIMYLIGSGNIVESNGTLRERLQVEVLFASGCEFDDTGKNYEAICDEMKKKALQWLIRLLLKEDANLRLRAINGSSREYIQYDAMLAGYRVNVTLEEVLGYSRCDLPQPEPEDNTDNTENV